nr:histone-like nucleoid-structuring protein Lsr2 [Streptomyces violaceusniger]
MCVEENDDSGDAESYRYLRIGQKPAQGGEEFVFAPENCDKLDAALRPFIEKGRNLGRMKETGRVRRGAADGPSAEEVRAWARENGHEVNDRGRVPKEIRDALDASH